MKTQIRPIALRGLMAAVLTMFAMGLHAQRIGATLNISSFDVNKIQNSNANLSDVSIVGSTAATLNLRYFTKSKFAIRGGAGIENLSYTLNDGLSTDFNVKRNDMKFLAGVEWHPLLSSFIDIYPGVYVPLTFIGQERGGLETATGDNTFSSGLGGVLGANIRILKFLRVGVEFDTKYENFRSAAVDAINEGSASPLGRLNYNTSFTVGVTF